MAKGKTFAAWVKQTDQAKEAKGRLPLGRRSRPLTMDDFTSSFDRLLWSPRVLFGGSPSILSYRNGVWHRER